MYGQFNIISLLPEVSLATPPLEARSAPTSITALRPQFIIREVVEVVQNSLRSLRRARNGRGGPRQLRGLVTQCLSEATRAWAALRRCPRPPQHPRGAAPARQHAIEAEGTWVYAENGRSTTRQPRGPLTRCLPEVPPASDHLRRRAPALSRLCRGYQPTIAPWLFEGPRSRRPGSDGSGIYRRSLLEVFKIRP